MAVFLSALKTIPWKALIAQAPVIINSASNLLQSIPRSPKETESDEKQNNIEQLQTRLESLEGSHQQNAEIVKQIADQLQAVTETLPVLGARLRLLLLFSLTGMILGLGALAVALFV